MTKKMKRKDSDPKLGPPEPQSLSHASCDLNSQRTASGIKCHCSEIRRKTFVLGS